VGFSPKTKITPPKTQDASQKMPGSGLANDAEVIIPEEPVTAMEIDNKTPEVDTLQSETNLSPMSHQPIMRSQSRQSDDTDLVGTLSNEKKKLAAATTPIPKLLASVLKSSRLQTPKLAGALRNIKDRLSIGGSSLEPKPSSICPLFTIQMFKNFFVSTTGIFKPNNKIGLGSGNMDKQPEGHDSIAQDVSMANI
jgi:hypothetical protein